MNLPVFILCPGYIAISQLYPKRPFRIAAYPCTTRRWTTVSQIMSNTRRNGATIIYKHFRYQGHSFHNTPALWSVGIISMKWWLSAITNKNFSYFFCLGGCFGLILMIKIFYFFFLMILWKLGFSYKKLFLISRRWPVRLPFLATHLWKKFWAWGSFYNLLVTTNQIIKVVHYQWSFWEKNRTCFFPQPVDRS